MSEAQGLLANEPLQRLDAQCKLPARERALRSDVPRTQAFKVLREKVLGAVDDAKVLRASALYGWLGDPASAFRDEVERFNDHAFSSLRRHLRPPSDCIRSARLIVKVNDLEWGSEQYLRVRSAELGNHLHVPSVRLVCMNRSFTRQDVEWCKFEIASEPTGQQYCR